MESVSTILIMDVIVSPYSFEFLAPLRLCVSLLPLNQLQKRFGGVAQAAAGGVD
jgi:hypothetical protein